MGGFPVADPVRRGQFHRVGQVQYLPERGISSASDEIGGNMTVSVAIQERSRLLREGLELILDPEPEIGVLGSVVGGEALFALCEKTTPSVVLLEVDVREWDPCRLAYRLQRVWPSLSFVGLYRRDGEAVARARRCGFRRLVSLQADARELVGEVTASAASAPPTIRPLATTAPAARQLTAREIQVLQFIGAGCTSRQIGDHMRVSHKTVENHKQRIFGKLGVQNQAHAVSVAFRKGYLRPEDVRTLADAQ
jgi:DNA-binding NarL/FixJ family response regulator